jgi:formate dehydrogenase iron-sulfur subunit
MSKAMLVDTTRCVGCRGCQVACKSWNELRAVRSGFSATGSSPAHLDADTFTRVAFQETSAADGTPRWTFVKRQCMHCEEPACAAACPVGALAKLASGPVVYQDDRCIGCRYCMVACPFQVPKFEWGSRVSYIRKCTFCADRQASGGRPACVATCPSEALAFGERKALLEEAHRRIEAHRARYHPEVYGERTAGGTGVLYLTAVPFDALGLQAEGFRTDLGDVPHGRAGREWMAKVPWIAAAVGGVSLALYRHNLRRGEVEAREGKEG